MTSNDIKLSDIIVKPFYEVHKAIKYHTHSHFRLKGGRGSTKSSCASIEIVLTIKNNPICNAVVMRKIAKTLRTSVYEQIKWAISALGVTNEFRCTISPMEITYLPTGQKILFFGADEPEKLKSVKVSSGYIAITWFEEADQFKGAEEIRKILQSTMRGGEKFWNFETYNPPITQSNWINKDSLITRNDRLIHTSNYLDVPAGWLGQQFIDEAEHLKEINEKAYRHEYLGEPVGTGGAVFENVIVRKIADEEIKQFDRLYHGLDFGWYPDPNHFTGCHYNAAQRKLFIFNEIRRNKTSNEAMAKLLESWKEKFIVADSSELKSISDFRAWGFNMRSAEKGPDSVDYSIKWLQSLNEIIIDSNRCPYTATEFLEYEYERDKNGDVITGYPDKNNHAIDAVRYALNFVWKRRGE